MRWRDGRIEIERAALLVKLEYRGRLLVVVAEQAVLGLRTDSAEQTRQALQHESRSATAMGAE